MKVQVLRMIDIFIIYRYVCHVLEYLSVILPLCVIISISVCFCLVTFWLCFTAVLLLLLICLFFFIFLFTFVLLIYLFYVILHWLIITISSSEIWFPAYLNRLEFFNTFSAIKCLLCCSRISRSRHSRDVWRRIFSKSCLI